MSKRQIRRSHAAKLIGLAAAGVATLLVRQQSAHAATDTWTGGGASSGPLALTTPGARWGDSGWTGGNNPAANGDDLVFGAASNASNKTIANDNSANTANLLSTANSLTFNSTASGWTINAFNNATALTLGSGGIVNNSTAAETINELLFLSGTTTFNTSTTGTISIGSSGISLNGQTLLFTGGNASGHITANVLLGNGNLSVSGTGQDAVSGAITGSGIIVVNQNSGSVMNFGSSISGAYNITLGGSGTTSIAGKAVNSTISVTGGINSYTATTNAGVFTDLANAYTNNVVTITGGTISLGNAIDLTKGGTVTTITPGTVNTTGMWTGGAVQLTSASNVLPTSGSWAVSNSATQRIGFTNNFNIGSNTFSLLGQQGDTFGTVTISNGGSVVNNATGLLSLSGASIAAGATGTFNASGSSITVASLSVGAGATLIKAGSNNFNTNWANATAIPGAGSVAVLPGDLTVSVAGGVLSNFNVASTNGNLTISLGAGASISSGANGIYIGTGENLTIYGVSGSGPNTDLVTVPNSTNWGLMLGNNGQAAGIITIDGGTLETQIGAVAGKFGSTNTRAQQLIIQNGGQYITMPTNGPAAPQETVFTNGITVQSGGAIINYTANAGSAQALPFTSSTITLNGGSLASGSNTANGGTALDTNSLAIGSSGATVAMLPDTTTGNIFHPYGISFSGTSMTGLAGSSSATLTVDYSHLASTTNFPGATVFQFAQSSSTPFTGLTYLKGFSGGAIGNKGGQLTLANTQGLAVAGDLLADNNSVVSVTGASVNQFSTTTNVRLNSAGLWVASSSAQQISSLAQTAGSLSVAGGNLTVVNAYTVSGGGTFVGPGSLTAAAYSLGGGSVTTGVLASAAPITAFAGNNSIGTVIANATSLNVANSNLTLSAANTFTGNTTIGGSGTLLLSGASGALHSSRIIVGDTAANSSAVLNVSGLTGGKYTLLNTQTLGGHGSIVGTVATANGSTLSPGNSIGTTTYQNLSIVGGTVLSWDFDSSGAGGSTASPNALGDLLNITGALTLPAAAGTPINISQASGTLGTGVYELMHYGSYAGQTGSNLTSLFNYNGAALAGNVIVFNDTTNNNIDLSIAGSTPSAQVALSLAAGGTNAKVFANSSLNVAGTVGNSTTASTLSYVMESNPSNSINYTSGGSGTAAGGGAAQTFAGNVAGTASGLTLGGTVNSVYAIANDATDGVVGTSNALSVQAYNHATPQVNATNAPTAVNVNLARVTQGTGTHTGTATVGAASDPTAAGMTYTVSNTGDTSLFTGGISNSAGTVAQGASTTYTGTITANTSLTGARSVTQAVSYSDEAGITGGGSLGTQNVVFNQTIDALAEHVTQATASTTGSTADYRTSFGTGTISLAQGAQPGEYFGRTDVNGSSGSSVAKITVDRSATTGFATPQYFLFKFTPDANTGNVSAGSLTGLEADLSSYGYTFQDHYGTGDATGQDQTNLTKALTDNGGYDLGIELNLSGIDTSSAPPSYMDFDFGNYSLTAYNVAAVPEPTTIGLLAIPMVGLLARRRRREQKPV